MCLNTLFSTARIYLKIKLIKGFTLLSDKFLNKIAAGSKEKFMNESFATLNPALSNFSPISLFEYLWRVWTF
ncbi:hypothetical protein A3H21_02505 [Candidatus Woesebacteria bacterium RIFCSPLOWO2_12_FULL_42_8]|nr:MAG: hypothetical protein A3H21_02505 [Candidatus Woesebacteria bacterium RIFCSPLOWO2_12_FULL_42_8]